VLSKGGGLYDRALLGFTETGRRELGYWSWDERRDEGIMGQDEQEDKALICPQWEGLTGLSCLGIVAAFLNVYSFY
jgi:hypothetical protein